MVFLGVVPTSAQVDLNLFDLANSRNVRSCIGWPNAAFFSRCQERSKRGCIAKRKGERALPSKVIFSTTG